MSDSVIVTETQDANTKLILQLQSDLAYARKQNEDLQRKLYASLGLLDDPVLQPPTAQEKVSQLAQTPMQIGGYRTLRSVISELEEKHLRLAKERAAKELEQAGKE
jgi:hypothetical protein